MRPLSDQTKFILANPKMSSDELAKLGRKNGYPRLTQKKVTATRWRTRHLETPSAAPPAPEPNGHANGHAKHSNGPSESEAAFLRALWVIGFERAQQLIESVSNGH